MLRRRPLVIALAALLAAMACAAAIAGEKPTNPAPPTVSEEAMRASEQRYLNGVVLYQKGNYIKARDEWTLALRENPGNSDARAGVDRIADLFGEKRPKPAVAAQPAVAPKPKTRKKSAAPARRQDSPADLQRMSQQHYLSGVIYFQKRNFVAARNEWTLSLQLDPANEDAKAGLERVMKFEKPAPSQGKVKTQR